MGDIEDGSKAAQGAQLQTEEIETGERPGLLSRIFDAFSTEDTAVVEPANGVASVTSEADGMINLRRMRVEDVAIPTADIVAVPNTISLDEMVQIFRESGMTRIPVYEGTLDTPLGLAHLKDLALLYGFNGDHRDGFDLTQIMRPLLFVPPSMSIGVLMTKMQTERRHMALVIDEYGGVDGLLTIEDLIEQVVGEIEDEHDTDEDQMWICEKPGVYVAQAKAPLPEFEAEIGRSLTSHEDVDEEEIDTLGGLVFMLSGRVPTRGEVVPHPEGPEFEVIDADPRRIKRLRVRIPDEGGMIRNPVLRGGLAFGLGVVGACGLAPFGFWYLTVLSLLSLPAVFLPCQSWKQAAWVGWAFGVGWFGNGLAWIVEPFLVDAARHGWMAPFAVLFLAGGLALFWGGAFGLAWQIGRGLAFRTLFLILFWSLAEFGRAYLFTGFPWAAVAQAWIMPEALRFAGPHMAGLLALLWTLPVGAVLAAGWMKAESRAGGALGAIAPSAPPARRLRRISVWGWAALSLVPALVLTFAAYLGPHAGVPTDTGQTVRLIQPNAPQHLKWDPEHMPIFFQRSLDFTAAEPKPDLIVWPESSVPVFLHQADTAFERIAEAANGVPVIVGIQRYDGARVFNSLVVIDAQGQLAGVYDKHHLVPFGEYMPLSGLAARLGLFGLAANTGIGYSPGPGAKVMEIDGIGAVLPLICYEAVFPQDVNAAPSRPDILVQITNDAWFGTRTGPYQHLVQAQLRAIEQGIPLIRAANTGVSAVIDPQGQVIASIPLNEAGYVDAPLPSAAEPTVYARHGDWPVFLLLLIAIISAVFGQSLIRGRKRPLTR